MLASNHHYRNFSPAKQWIACALLVCVSGCTGLRLPAIDPSGERIFLPQRYTTIDDGSSFRGPVWTSPPQAPTCNTPADSAAVVPYSLNTPTPPLYGPFTTPNPYGTPPMPAMGIAPSAQLSGVTSTDPRDGLQGRLALSPARMAVPVGQEVIIRAAICGNDGYLMTGEPLEWSLAPNSVGTILEVDQQNKALWRQLLRRPPYKRESDFARGLTSRAPQVVPRGTPSPYDDLQLARGETWISVTSASPGETHIHCLAPTIAGWEQRRASTTIQWVGAGGLAPRPAAPGNVTIGPPVPSYPTNQSLPPANVPPTLPTNPAPSEPALPPIQPQLAFSITGPANAKADEELTYRMNVRNSGQADARDVEISSKIPFGLRSVQSEPQGSVFGDRLVWRIGTLPPGQSRDITMRHIGERGGQMRVCATLDYRGSDRVEKCTTTTVELNALSVDVRGPSNVRIGSSLPLQIFVTNHSDRALNNVILRDEYGSGLFHPEGPSPIETNVGSIGPGQSKTFPIDFQVRGAGKLCQRVTVRADDGSQASKEFCVDAGGPSSGTPAFDGPAFGGPTLGGPANQARFVVQKTGPVDMSVGGPGMFKIQITNTGQVPLNGLEVIDEFDPRIIPKQATYGVKRDGNRMSWRLPQLGVGHTTTIEVVTQGGAAADRACSRATVTSSSGVTETAVKCVRIIDPNASYQPRPERALETQLVADKLTPVRTGIHLSGGLQPIEDKRRPDVLTDSANKPLAPRSGSPFSFSPFRPLGAGGETRAPHHNILRDPAEKNEQLHAIPFARGTTFPLESKSGRPTPMSANWQVDIRRHNGHSLGNDRMTYTVRITNRDSQVEEDVRLTIESPQGTEFVSSINPPMIREARRSSDSRTIEFFPIASLRPDETATFQIVVQRGDSLGGTLRAKVASARWPDGSVFQD